MSDKCLKILIYNTSMSKWETSDHQCALQHLFTHLVTTHAHTTSLESILGMPFLATES